MMKAMERDADTSVKSTADHGTVTISQETLPEGVFAVPSVDSKRLLLGQSYTHSSTIPAEIASSLTTECVLGVDEAGRGPVLGPMVYALCYLPKQVEKSLLAEAHRFDDSKVLTPAVRSSLMETLCTRGTDLFQHCGWATRILSARDISSGMMQANGIYNLNNQAMDATVSLIQGVFDQGVNVTDIFIDTIGNPQTYQKKLERIFPQAKVTVATKADSLYPCVSAASVCAKVTRDAALEVCFEPYRDHETPGTTGWGSGYPSDTQCTDWMKGNMDPLFGWGPECRFSWGTAKDMVEGRTTSCKVEWPVNGEDEDGSMRLTGFLKPASNLQATSSRPAIAYWYGRAVTGEIF